MAGEEIPAKLALLAKDFDRIARPKHLQDKNPAA
jgi:hypothetical protein